MRVALVCLPWSAVHRPSSALGALAAYARQQEPEWTVDAYFEYVSIAGRMGLHLYDYIAMGTLESSELLWMALFFPEQRARVKEHFVTAHALDQKDATQYGHRGWSEAFDHILTQLEEGVRELVQRLAEKEYELVGLSTCFSQLFGNLLLARYLKAARPQTKIVLGGSTVSGRVGGSLLQHFDAVDFVVQGEGERPLVALARSLSAGAPTSAIPGVLCRENCEQFPEGVSPSEVPDMDRLPLPDFSGYAQLAKAVKLAWHLPIEGSRGCWWDRTRRLGNPKSTCYFCNLNVQWGGYRHKSRARLSAEIAELCDRYQRTEIYFVDNIIRHHEVQALAADISALGKDLTFFYELRAHVSPYELLVLWEAGLRSVQLGIEALSTRLLQRMGKGTRAIQNLQAMRTCLELRIENSANLIIDFPGSTPEEVAESCQNVSEFAVSFQPCVANPFMLGIDSTVDRLSAEFGVSGIRNRDAYRVGLPEDMYRSLSMFDLSFDGSHADFSALVQACTDWKKRFAGLHAPLLSYADAGTFLRITDNRQGLRSSVLTGAARRIYLLCMQITRLDRILEEAKEMSREEVQDFLDRAVALRLIFREEDEYLSLAVAESPQTAARRIRAAHARDAERKIRKRPGQLAIVD